MFYASNTEGLRSTPVVQKACVLRQWYRRLVVYANDTEGLCSTTVGWKRNLLGAILFLYRYNTSLDTSCLGKNMYKDHVTSFSKAHVYISKHVSKHFHLEIYVA